jgi:hypothetical protein
MSDVNNPLTQRLEGPAPVMEVAKDLVRRLFLIAPIFIAVGAIFWQTQGAASVAYGLAIVIVNFLLAASLLAWAGRISFAAMGGAAMFGFLIRLGLIFIAVLVVKDASWIDMLPLGLTLIVAHLGILFWEMRYISGTLAHPGLKPSTTLPIHAAASNDGDTSETPDHETTGAA